MYLHFRLMCFKEGKLNKNTQQKKGWRVAKGVFLCKKTCAQSSLLLLKVMGCRLLGNWVISQETYIDAYNLKPWLSLCLRDHRPGEILFSFFLPLVLWMLLDKEPVIWALLAVFKVLLQWYIAQTKLQQNPPAEMDPGGVTWVEIV